MSKKVKQLRKNCHAKTGKILPFDQEKITV